MPIVTIFYVTTVTAFERSAPGNTSIDGHQHQVLRASPWMNGSMKKNWIVILTIDASTVSPCASSAMSSKPRKRKCPRSVARNDAGSRMLLTISKAKIRRNGSRG